MISKKLTQKQLKALANVVIKFVEKYRITCPEHIGQCDNVIIGASDLIEDLADIVGYYEYPEF
jgi:hypothetical protein